MKRCLVGLAVAAALVVAAQAYAHHSFAATYLEDQRVQIEGELVQFQFRNPHSFVHVMVKEKDGSMVRYGVEWGGAGQLGGQGVTRDTLKVGDHVIITGSPGRNPTGSSRAHGDAVSAEGRFRLGQDVPAKSSTDVAGLRPAQLQTRELAPTAPPRPARPAHPERRAREARTCP